MLKLIADDVPNDDAPLGVVSLQEYQRFSTKLEVGDMVLSYSNVLSECRCRGGRILGIEGLLGQLRQLDPSRPATLAAQLIARIQNEDTDNLAEDDATVLLCRASKKRVPWRDNLLAPLRLWRSIADKTSFEW